MKERPIVLSELEVRLILAGSKTQLRRPLKPQPIILEPGGRWSWHCDTHDKWDYSVPNDDNFSFRRGTEGVPALRQMKDGVELPLPPQYRSGFPTWWKMLNGQPQWELNPWVWVVSFRKLEGQAK
jgi:hypothetical protein